jgi:aminoglycoside phosphotransferase (APT) family kinase protein
LIPIRFNEIPIEMKDYVGTIKSVTYPRQGHTSDVCIIESDMGYFVLKRTQGERYCTWLSQEVFVLNCLSQTNLPIPKVYRFIEEKDKSQSWVLIEYIEGETLRNYLSNECNEDKRHEMFFHFGKILSQVHATPCPPELVKNSLWLEDMRIVKDL